MFVDAGRDLSFNIILLDICEYHHAELRSQDEL